MDFTRPMFGPVAGTAGRVDGVDEGVPPPDWSAVSNVVGRSIRRWIWMPSPGPMCDMWLKLDGAEIIFERRSGFLKTQKSL